MFTRSMLAYAEDHWERMLSATRRWAAIGACAGIVLANVRDPAGEPAAEASSIDDGPALQAAPLFDGMIPAPIIRSLTPTLLPSTLPILLAHAGDEGQVRAFA